MEDNYVVILGPTASGKTALSIELAKRTNGEIISADSMYIYRGMNIGTAKPSKEEMQGIVHHLIDIVEPTEDFTVYDYQICTQRLIKDIKSKGKLPIVVGGTGLYIRALTEDFSLKQIPQNIDVRNKYYSLIEDKGKEYVHSLLKNKDDFAYNKLHFNDYRRVVRALEVYELTGQSIYSLQNRSQLSKNILYVGLTMDRAKLYERVNQRVEIMLESGLIEEVKYLLDLGIPKDSNPMKGIGYRQVIQYLDGEIEYAKMVELLKRDTRHYAKRQLTWFRTMENILWIDLTVVEPEEALRKIFSALKEKSIFPRI